MRVVRDKGGREMRNVFMRFLFFLCILLLEREGEGSKEDDFRKEL